MSKSKKEGMNPEGQFFVGSINDFIQMAAQAASASTNEAPENPNTEVAVEIEDEENREDDTNTMPSVGNPVTKQD